MAALSPAHAGDDLAALAALSRVRGLGCAAILRLIARWGDATLALQEARAMSREALFSTCGLRLSAKTARHLRAADPEASRDLLERATRRGIRILGVGGPGYPAELLDLPDPPPLLFQQGAGRFDGPRSVGIVGTRAASSYGRRSAHRLGRELGGWGWTVVSGMARGVDAAAHAGALDGGGGSIGVLGCGHDHEYPPDNGPLYARMREEGLLVSEFEPDTPPTRHAFPRRNRLIAALGRALVVVEAGVKSGALITADQALDLGREVLAVPGRVGDPGAVGTLALLRTGAGLAEGSRDVFEALGWLRADEPVSGRAEGECAPPERRGAVDVLRVLGREPRSPDEVAVQLDLPIAEAVRELGKLELEGWVERRGGGRFRAIRPAAGRAGRRRAGVPER